jgi:hypothetical protein
MNPQIYNVIRGLLVVRKLMVENLAYRDIYRIIEVGKRKNKKKEKDGRWDDGICVGNV